MSKDKILKNLARQLLIHGKIKTTESRAKALREVVARKSGFTRITKLGTRLGDNAPMALVEFVANQKPVTTETQKVKETQKKKAYRKRKLNVSK